MVLNTDDEIVSWGAFMGNTEATLYIDLHDLSQKPALIGEGKATWPLISRNSKVFLKKR